MKHALQGEGEALLQRTGGVSRVWRCSRTRGSLVGWRDCDGERCESGEEGQAGGGLDETATIHGWVFPAAWRTIGNRLRVGAMIMERAGSPFAGRGFTGKLVG